MAQGPPRIFKLYDELENAEKNQSADPTISLGLAQGADPTELTSWAGSIMGMPGSQFQDKFYSLEMECGEDYPAEPPATKFVNQKINLPSVGPDGKVNFAQNTQLNQWNSSMSMMDVLKALKGEMASKKGLNQPQEGVNY